MEAPFSGEVSTSVGVSTKRSVARTSKPCGETLSELDPVRGPEPVPGNDATSQKHY